MDFVTYAHRHGITIAEQEFEDDWNELQEVLKGITDEDLISQYPISTNKMSLSAAINDLIKERLSHKGWINESPIFNDSAYNGGNDKRWRLDFVKNDFSIEVAFNHGEAIAWNLLKPVLASELNHVEKARQTKMGVVIFATKDMKSVGAFDNTVGDYEKALRYMKPLNNVLTVPMIIIGLKAPETFKVEKEKINGRNIGKIVPLSPTIPTI